jgi:predicted small integral membrane protein
LWRARRGTAAAFQRAKRMAVSGLAVGVLLWLGGFVAIGGEWFGMWMSSQWNGIESAFRFAIVLLAMLVWLGQRDDELDD